MRTEKDVALNILRVKRQSIPIEILEKYVVCRMGEHAGGIIFVDEPFTNITALMRVPNGDLVTQFDLHDCEDASQPIG